MELSAVLRQRKLDANSPYKPEAWKRALEDADIIHLYPNLPQQLRTGFDAGIRKIHETYAPPNKPTIVEYLSEFNRIIQTELALGCYIGPLSVAEVEYLIGPFQTSPLSIIPKPGKPGKFRLVQNLSYPHLPRNHISSINSTIDSNSYPCTYGTFTVASVLIGQLPPGSQAAVRDVKEAYRTIPLAPSQWPGMVVRLHDDDSYAIDTRNCFGLASSGGCYGIVSDAGAQIMRHRGIGPLCKWVDDKLLARILRKHLEKFNAQRQTIAAHIAASSGQRHDGGQLWYKGEDTQNGQYEQYDEDLTAPLLDLSSRSPRSHEDAQFTYCMSDVDEISKELGIPWELEKDIPFGNEVPYIGFVWNLELRTVSIPNAKKAKYLAAIFAWEKERTHTLSDTQRLYGKLLHASQVVPAGRAYLTSLEKFMATFGNSSSVFMPRTPPRNTATDLFWWKTALTRPTLSRPIPGPHIVLDTAAYSDASSTVGIGIVIGGRWRAWRLLPGWKEDGRDIGWAEAVGFLFLVLTILGEGHQGTHQRVYGDNEGVVQGWWKGRSRNTPTNNIFKLIHTECEYHETTFYTRYVATKDNPADGPSRGIYGPKSLLLPPIHIPRELLSLVVDFDTEPQATEIRYRAEGHYPKPDPKPPRTPRDSEQEQINFNLERNAEELFAQTQVW